MAKALLPLRDRLRIFIASKDYRWAAYKLGDVMALNRHNGTTNIALAMCGPGMLLFWQLSEEPDVRLIAYLTRREAAMIADTDWRVGLLEPIRASMKHPHGVVGVGSESHAFEIPGDVSEEEFIERVMHAGGGPRVAQSVAHAVDADTATLFTRVAQPAF